MKIQAWNFLPFLSLLTGVLSQLQFSDDLTPSGYKSNVKNNKSKSTVHSLEKKPGNLAVRQQEQINSVPNLLGLVGSKKTEEKLVVRNGKAEKKINLVRFQRQNLPDFPTAIGAISARLAGQISPRPVPSQKFQRQEYIPYPPNGNPFDYPAYRGFSHGNDVSQSLPLARYEIFNNGNNYRIQSAANPNAYTANRDSINTDFSFPFPNGFGQQTFDPNFFFNGFLPIIDTNREREPLEDDDDYNSRGKGVPNLERPIK